MTDNTLDRAVQAAAEALRSERYTSDHDYEVTRIAVEAAAPVFYGEMFQAAEGELQWQIRAERAEAEVERLREMNREGAEKALEWSHKWGAEAALADRLAEALRPEAENWQRNEALAAYEEAR